MNAQTVVVHLALILSAAVVGSTAENRDCPPWFKWVNTSGPHYCACVTVVKDYIVCDQ